MSGWEFQSMALMCMNRVTCEHVGGDPEGKVGI